MSMYKKCISFTNQWMRFLSFSYTAKLMENKFLCMQNLTTTHTVLKHTQNWIKKTGFQSNLKKIKHFFFKLIIPLTFGNDFLLYNFSLRFMYVNSIGVSKKKGGKERIALLSSLLKECEQKMTWSPRLMNR